MKQEDPPLTDPDKVMFWFILVWIISIIALIWGISMCKEEFKKADLSLTGYFLAHTNLYETDLSFVDSSIPAQAPPYSINGRVCSTIIDRIIECESGGDPTAKNPDSTAYGLCQFVDGTWDYVQEKWDMKLDRKDEYDQRYACERLFREEGESHWITTEWCWSK